MARKEDDVRWQPSGARQPKRRGDGPAFFPHKNPGQTVKGSPKRECGGVHQFGVPPRGNANFAWVQHFIHHLATAAPGSSGGMAGFVLANGSMSSNQSGGCPRGAHSKTRSTNSQSLGRQRDIRGHLIEADLVDCMVALPGQLFYSTQIPVCLWFLAKSKAAKDRRARHRETLFIDARKMGTLMDWVHRALTESRLAEPRKFPRKLEQSNTSVVGYRARKSMSPSKLAARHNSIVHTKHACPS
ncbi:MAG: type restriction enzyme protein [Chthoniobacter sp.]|jgi:hypothetical protein|nr:type restriction enzyme protein [Chthoniobacter sp.]